jgi:hypothetical protein
MARAARRDPRVVFTIALVAVVLVGCATLPPLSAVQDLKSIAGTWEGSFRVQKGQFQGTDTIREDGTGDWSATWTGGSDRGTESFLVDNGVIRWRSSSGRSGTVTLHEGDGKRVLTWTYDGCEICSGRSTPAK